MEIIIIALLFFPSLLSEKQQMSLIKGRFSFHSLKHQMGGFKRAYVCTQCGEIHHGYIYVPLKEAICYPIQKGFVNEMINKYILYTTQIKRIPFIDIRQ